MNHTSDVQSVLKGRGTAVRGVAGLFIALCVLLGVTIGVSAAPTGTPLYEGYLAIDGVSDGALRTRLPEPVFGILSVEYAVEVPAASAATGGGAAAGRRTHKPIKIVKEWDASAPRLFEAVVTGKHFKGASLHFLRPGATADPANVEFTVKLTDVTIASFRVVCGGDPPTPNTDTRERVEIALAFAAIQLEDKASKTSATFDFGKNR
jgi:type VI secretion system secreted protein Hcp